ncbi:MAG: YihY/virulence factor BrkB family protein [Acidimicrobiales bacterium]
MKAVRAALQWINAAQQRHLLSAVVFGVLKKFGDDNGGNLITTLTYTGFVTVFPLLLLLVTVLGLVLSSDVSARHAILNSTLRQFPVVGSELGHNISALRKSSTIGLVVGLVGLLYGSLGLAGAGMYAMDQVWNIPGTDRPGFLPRTARSVVFLAVLGLGIAISTFLSGIGTFGSRQPLGIEIGAVFISALVNCTQYLLAFRVLTPKKVGTKALVPGAVFGGVGWTILQGAGTYLVGHTLKGDSATYGTFAAVLGLLAWIYLGARLTIYAAELNVVLERRLWPRSIVQPPLTPADRRSLAAQAEQNRRRPEQHVEVSFDEQATGADSGAQAPDAVGAGGASK